MKLPTSVLEADNSKFAKTKCADCGYTNFVGRFCERCRSARERKLMSIDNNN